MYNLNDIQGKFFTDKLITFKSSLNSDSSVLDSDLTGKSKSNRYFNTGVNPYISIENIEAMSPILSDYTITAYSAATTYGNYNTTFDLSDVVIENSKYYISIATANDDNLVTDTDYWKETTLMSLILKDKIRSSIELVVSNLITPNFIEDNVYMFRIADTSNDLIENTSKLVGYRIVPTSSDHLLFIINQIGLFFESDETITLYLYNQNKLISSFEVNSAANLFEWVDITEFEITSNTGAWYLYYDQSTLSGRAIGDNTIFNNYMYNHANITPFEMDSVSDLDNITQDNLVYDKNYGLNLNFSISYDMTKFVNQHLIQFVETIQKQFEYDILNMFYSNPDAQSCLRERNITIDKLVFELKSFEGDTVINKLNKSYKRLRATLNKLGYKDNAFADNQDDNFTIGSI